VRCIENSNSSTENTKGVKEEGEKGGGCRKKQTALRFCNHEKTEPGVQTRA